MADPDRTLTEHEDRIHDWLETLRDRRAKLQTLRETLDNSDREDIPEELQESLVELLGSLEADLQSQVEDLEGDLEMIADLRDTFGDVTDPEVEAELERYAGELDDVFDEKSGAVEDLIAATDRLIDRFEDLLTGRYLDE